MGQPDQDQIVRRWVGDGSEFFSGIVAADLTQAYYDALTPEQRDTVDNSPLYEKPAAVARAERAAAADDEADESDDEAPVRTRGSKAKGDR